MNGAKAWERIEFPNQAIEFNDQTINIDGGDKLCWDVGGFWEIRQQQA